MIVRIWKGKKEMVDSYYFSGQVWDIKRQLLVTVTDRFKTEDEARMALEKVKKITTIIEENFNDTRCFLAGRRIEMAPKTDVIEQLRARIAELEEENARLKVELAKYHDAYVVAYLYKYRNCFGDEVWTTDHNWGNRIPFESKPLIVKPEENK